MPIFLAYRAVMSPTGPVIDLHTHSRCSDGTDTPAEVMHAAVRARVDVVALTDHDVVTGWDEAGQSATELGIVLVPGIEVSCQVSGVSVHLLAYLPDPDEPGLRSTLEEVRRHRDTRIQRTVELLAADGYPVDYADVVAHAGAGATLGRPHVADALVRAGRYPDREAAFADVLHGRSRYYVQHWAPDPVEAVQMVAAAGGVPVMAHPFAAARGRTVGDEVIEDMVDAGLRGLEVDHRDHGAAERAHARRLCRRLGLLATGASDYHGLGKPNRLGENTTSPEVLQAIVSLASGTSTRGAPLR
jgi:3',5'-nucleoside bisphosphate phosphatase